MRIWWCGRPGFPDRERRGGLRPGDRAGREELNQAAAVGKLGGDVAMLGCVGDDGNGAMLVKSPGERRGRRQPGREPWRVVSTGSAMIAVDDAGSCIIVSPGANGRLSADDVNAAADFFATADSSSVLTLTSRCRWTR